VSRKGVFRFELDLIVAADTLADAKKAIQVAAPHLLRSYRFTTIRDSQWTNPAWKVTDDGEDGIKVEPARRRAKRVG
jgi:hypothetical protein